MLLQHQFTLPKYNQRLSIQLELCVNLYYNSIPPFLSFAATLPRTNVLIVLSSPYEWFYSGANLYCNTSYSSFPI